ncbi:MAG: DinB family protein [Candidatus Nanopelagicales bacterium]
MTDDLAARVDDYEAATRHALEVLGGVAPDDLDRRHPDGWSARQVAHHLADSETQSHTRLRRLLAEPPGSVIQGYDEAAWARSPLLGYADLPVAEPLAVLAAVRASSLALLRRLSPEDLSRYGMHTESGRYTVDDWLRIYAAHPVEHADQAARALRGLA